MIPNSTNRRAGSDNPICEYPYAREPVSNITLRINATRVKLNLIQLPITNYALRSTQHVDSIRPTSTGFSTIERVLESLVYFVPFVFRNYLPTARNHAGGRLNMRFTTRSNGSVTSQSSTWMLARCTFCNNNARSIWVTRPASSTFLVRGK